MNRSNPPPPPFWDFISGLVIVPVLHAVFITLLMIILPFFLMLAVGIGLSQFLYLIPLILGCQRQGRFEAVKGILVAAFLTILLNGACGTIITPSAHAWLRLGDDTLLVMGLSMFMLIVTAFYGLKPRSRPK
jgi:hypothetical protein